MENNKVATKHAVKILKTDYLTHNVKRFVVTKPEGYNFISGQATDLAISLKGIENFLRPFTFTSTSYDEHLEFIIKIYDDHDGMTKKLISVKEGDELFVHDVFGSIHYKGPGLFIAGGAGITPFISIFRKLRRENKSEHNTLLFANRTEADIILKEELKEILGERCINIVENGTGAGLKQRRIDIEFLKAYVSEKFSYYYICGTENFTNAMVKNISALGIEMERIVIEQ